jgi:hypothetical protein
MYIMAWAFQKLFRIEPDPRMPFGVPRERDDALFRTRNTPFEVSYIIKLHNTLDAPMGISNTHFIPPKIHLDL